MCAAASRPHSGWSDRQLIEACLEGDARAWEVLVLRYQNLVYTIPRRYGLSDLDVEDVFQNVFLHLLKGLHTLRDHDRLSAWLMTVARRECWRVTRQQRHHQSNVDDHEASLQEVAHNLLPEEEVERLEEYHLVRQALQRLDERCRYLLQRLYVDRESPSYAELAVETGLPVGSIGPTRARCLQKVLRLLHEAGWHTSQ